MSRSRPFRRISAWRSKARNGSSLSYLLMLGALLLVGGAAGNRFGRRRMFALGAVVFTAFSVVCGVAPNASILIAGRALQGVGGALLVPGSLAIISAAYPAQQRSRAIGIWAGFSAITTALGPVLGGWLVDAVSWRAIFFINVPLALLTLGATLAGVPESRDPAKDGAVDWKGGLLATLGLGSIRLPTNVQSRCSLSIRRMTARSAGDPGRAS
jgi:MFS family permease